MPETGLADSELSPDVTNEHVPVRRPGPGLPECLLWLAGAMTVQLIGSLLGYICVIGKEWADLGFDPHQLQSVIRGVTTGKSIVIILSVALIPTLAFTIFGAMLRLGADGFVRLGFRRPTGLQALLIFGLVLPLQLVCVEFFRVAKMVVPDTGMDQTLSELKQAPLFALVILVGVLPALWEELLCRGLIGRGLVSRWGLIPGILITSVLFGAMHLNPAHALAVLPLGIVLHYVYLTTRSLWGPMLLHFLNNAMSVVLLKMGDADPGSAADGMEATGISPAMLTISIMVTTALLMLLWQTRTRFLYEDGSEWTPGYPSLEQPPAGFPTKAIQESPRGLLLACSTACFVLGIIGVVWQLKDCGILATK